MIKQFLSQNSHWQINKTLAKEIGLDATLILTDLVDKKIYFDNRDELLDGEWFFNTTENIEENTTLSYYKQKKALKILEEYGFIEIKLMTIPAKQHFKINESEILNYFNTSFKETSKLDVEKLKNKSSKNSKRINKNKINNNKFNNVDIMENEISLKDEFLENEFLDFYCDFFGVKKNRQLREKILRELCLEFRKKKDEVFDFKNQFFAYVKYKKLTGERKHRWNGFLQDYNETDYMQLLENEKNELNNKIENTKNNGKKEYIGGRQTKEQFTENTKQWGDAFDGIDL